MPQGERPFALLGELIDRFIRTLAATKHWTMRRAVMEVANRTDYSEAAIYRWRQGRLRPPDETLEVLARIGREEAGLDRAWGKTLLQAARHPDADRLVDEIWGPEQLRSIPHNLPPREHTRFIGRKAEMARLLELLSPRHAAHLISVDGIGGVGKTALVLEAAYRCLWASTGEVPDPKAPTFDAIIFASAKQHYLTPHGILRRQQAQRTLRDIFREVARTLDRPDITHAALEDQSDRVRDALARQRTLLIVDNLETVEDREDILSFLYDLPSPVKVIITTREQALFSPIRLDQLSEEESLQLIRHESQEKGITLTDEQIHALHQRLGGIPAAIVYTVGQLAAGHSIEVVLQRVTQASGDVARFCFEGSVAPLRGQPAHRLLMSIAMFPKRALREAVIAVAGLGHDPIAADEGLARLQQLSLIGHRDGRYSMLPLTREYALAELAAHPDFERDARERWINWYVKFVQKYGGYDWEEGHIKYDRLDEEWENLLAVFDWCADQEKYEEMRFFWRSWAEGVGEFTNVYGYWNERLVWLEWLIEAAERRGDWSTAVAAMSNKGWTLVFMGRYSEAESTLHRAWTLRQHTTPFGRSELAGTIAVLYLRQGKYAEALKWLDHSEAALKQMDLRSQDPQFIRWNLVLSYHRAQVCFKQGDYRQAEALFRRVFEQAQVIRWQRLRIYAQNWLADLAIAKGQVDAAERLLQTGLHEAKRIKAILRTAFYKRSFAHLERRRGNVAEARRWATEALDDFDRLGMKPEAEEMRQLLEGLRETEPGEA